MKKQSVRSNKLVLIGAACALALSCGVWSAHADPYATAILGDSPVGFWQLYETTGSTAVDSAGSHSGTYTNATLGQPGYQAGSNPSALSAGFGGAFSQSQNSLVGGIALDFATNVNAALSAEAWVKGSGVPASAGIFGKGTGSAEQFYLDCGGTGNAFRFFARGSNGTAVTVNSTLVPDGNWHHLVGVCDQAHSNIFLYIDGLLAASNTMTGGLRVSSNSFMNIGSRQSTSAAYDDQFSGTIANVAVYNYALTAAKVQAHYFAAGIPPTITIQPTNTLTANEGAPVTLVSGAYGSTPLLYQWYVGSTAIAGETNATFFTNSVSGTFNGQFVQLVASNAFGTATDNGTTFLIFAGAPTIVTDVAPSSLTLYTGVTHQYSVTAMGTLPLSYQWIKNSSPVPGATNSTYVATTPVGTDSISVTVSNSFGPQPSSTVTLSGFTRPTGIYETNILAGNPIAYWPLNDASNSTIATEYVGGHVGTYTSTELGVPDYSAIDPDTAALFGVLATTDSYMLETDNSASGLPLVNISAPVGSNAEFSVEVWVNGPPNQNSAGSCIVSQGASGTDSFVIDASSGKNFRFYTRKPGGATSIINASAGPDNNWHHLVGTLDESNGGAMTLYIDGALNSQITGLQTTGLFSPTTGFSIGSQQASGDYTDQFVGTISHVSVYNYALTAAQVLAHYNAAPLPPYFTSQPPTNTVLVPGQKLVLSAIELGSLPRTNQWFSNNIVMPGQTNVSLLVNTTQTGTNSYSLKVSNQYGTTNSTPAVVQIPVGTGPVTLLTDTTPGSGGKYTTLPLTYSVLAFGQPPISYQWLFNGSPISGATNSSYTVASVQTTNAGSFSCAVSNSLSNFVSSASSLIVSGLPTNGYPRTILADHPVAYFRLDDATGSTNGYDYVGVNTGAYTALTQANLPTLQQPGYNTTLDTNKAVLFGNGGTGVFDDYLGNTITNIDFSVPNGQSGQFSVEAWVNGNSSTTQTGGACIVAKGEGGFEQFALDVNSAFRFYVRNSSGSTGQANAQASPIATNGFTAANKLDGKWHYVVGVCDQPNSNLLLYVDGKLIGPNIITNGVVPPSALFLDLNVVGTGTNGSINPGTGVNTTPVVINSTNAALSVNPFGENSISIGNRNKSTAHLDPGGAYDLPFVGNIDEVALYNYALSPLQVSNHYGAGIGTRLPLFITKVGGTSVVTWAGAGLLQSAPNVNGPWNFVNGATSPYTNTSSTNLFFRLKQN